MHTFRKPGFTLIELLIVLAILSLLMALLYPVFAHARQKANQATCASNLRQIGLATMQYGGDNDGLMFHTLGHADDSGLVTLWSFCWKSGQHPPVQTVDASCGPLAPFLRSASVWNCPSASSVQAADYFNPVPPAYGLNAAYVRAEVAQGHPVSFAQAESPAETIFAADCAVYSSVSPGVPSWSRDVYLPSDHAPTVHRRHSGMANVVWLDGHVSARKPVSPDATAQALNIGDILKGPYTGNAAIDDYYYELVKPQGE
jgi:prepilin-type N-terminal cleavage/methylation domain-containing protein/prepilin-type processing-associated H-X9-DG protein